MKKIIMASEQNPETYGYKLKQRADGYSVSKSRPYDDAEYYWAISTDKEHWKIIFNGKTVYRLEGDLEDVAQDLYFRNASIDPKIDKT